MGVTLIAKKMRIILIKMVKFNRKGELLKNRIKYWSDNCTFMKCCYYNACLSFFKFNLSYSDILDLSQSPHGSCIGWRSVICCSFGSLLQLSVAWLLHPCWIVHCVCKYLLYCIMIHCSKGYCTGWHWIIHCLLWQSGGEGAMRVNVMNKRLLGNTVEDYTCLPIIPCSNAQTVLLNTIHASL